MKLDDIDNMKDLQSAISNYSNKQMMGSVSEELELAEKLADLSETADGKATYRAANSLIRCSNILTNGNKSDCENFAGCVATAYAFATDNAVFSPGEARQILREVNDLAFDTQAPDAAFANVAICLDDRKMAEQFLKCTEKMAERMDAEGRDVNAADSLINAYGEIVKHHPDLANRCNKLVAWCADSQSDGVAFESAINYCDIVKSVDGVDKTAQAMARARSVAFTKKKDQALQLEAKKTQTRETSYDMEKNYSFDDYEYGY